MDLPARKANRLKEFDYSSSGVYFVTLCVKERKNLLWTKQSTVMPYSQRDVGANYVRPHEFFLSRVGCLVQNELEKWNKTYYAVQLDKYVVMPNHIHILVRIMPDANGRTQFAPTVSRMVKQFKGAVTKQIGYSIWQKSFHDHIVRDERDYLLIWNYIDTNPVKWALDRYYNAE